MEQEKINFNDWVSKMYKERIEETGEKIDKDQFRKTIREELAARLNAVTGMWFGDKRLLQEYSDDSIVEPSVAYYRCKKMDDELKSIRDEYEENESKKQNLEREIKDVGEDNRKRERILKSIDSCNKKMENLAKKYERTQKHMEDYPRGTKKRFVELNPCEVELFELLLKYITKQCLKNKDWEKININIRKKIISCLRTLSVEEHWNKIAGYMDIIEESFICPKYSLGRQAQEWRAEDEGRLNKLIEKNGKDDKVKRLGENILDLEQKILKEKEEVSVIIWKIHKYIEDYNEKRKEIVILLKNEDLPANLQEKLKKKMYNNKEQWDKTDIERREEIISHFRKLSETARKKELANYINSIELEFVNPELFYLKQIQNWKHNSLVDELIRATDGNIEIKKLYRKLLDIETKIFEKDRNLSTALSKIDNLMEKYDKKVKELLDIAGEEDPLINLLQNELGARYSLEG